MAYPIYYITLMLLYLISMIGGFSWLLNLISVSISLNFYSDLDVFSILILALGATLVSTWFIFTMFRLLQFIPYLFSKIKISKEGLKLKSNLTRYEKVIRWDEITLIKKNDTISGAIIISESNEILLVISSYLPIYKEVLYQVRDNSKKCIFKAI